MTVKIEPWDEKDEFVALLGRIANMHKTGFLDDLPQVIHDLRARYADDFDFQRRNIPASASGLERDRLKDPYTLHFLGLEPLEGDPTIEDVERELGDDVE